MAAKGQPRFFLNFYGRRTLRIFPLYYGVLIFILLIIPVLIHNGPDLVGGSLDHQAWLWLYLTNYAIIAYDSYGIFLGTLFHMAHFWTLAVEEHFYLGWPLIVRFLPKRRLMWGCFGVIALAISSRIWLQFTQGNDNKAAAILTQCRVDTLATGALAAVLLREYGIIKIQRFAAYGVIGCSLVIFWLFRSEYGLRPSGSHLPVLNFNILAVFFSCLLVLALATMRWRLTALLLANRPIVAMGKYSYGLYVYHGLISGLFGSWITVAFVQRIVPTVFLSLVVRGAIWGCLAFACAYASWHIYEKHWFKLKHHFQ